MMRRSQALLVALAAACGPVTGAPPPDAPTNACPAHPCEAYQGNLGVAQCKSGMCVVNTAFDHTLVVSVPSTAFNESGQTFAIRLAELFANPSAACPVGTCVRLPHASSTTVQYVPTPQVANVEVGMPVGGALASLPVRAYYRRLSSLEGDARYAVDVGLPLEPMVVSPRNVGTIRGPFGTAQVGFQATMPPGRYERIVEPLPPFDTAFPPDVNIITVTDAPGDPLIYVQAIEKTQKSGGTFGIPRFTISRQGGSASGWTVILRDAVTRRRISSIGVVGPDESVPVTLAVHRQYEPFGDALEKAELVIQPPPSEYLPRYVLVRQGGQPFESANYPNVPRPARVRGRVTSRIDNAQRPADIYLRATKLLADGKESTSLEYEAHIPAPDGTFDVLLPRGEYEGTVVPRGDAPMAYIQSFTVAAENDNQAGINFQVDSRFVVRGSALVADGRPLAGAEVEALPASSLAEDRTPADRWPRPVRTRTDRSGAFTLNLERGRYDVVVRPADGSRLPWLVSTSRQIEGDAVLDPLRIPAPVAVALKVVDVSNNPVARAIVRAYAAPSPEKQQSSALVEIGRAITRSDGTYEMFLAGPP
jgi:hypothetical protein